MLALFSEPEHSLWLPGLRAHREERGKQRPSRRAGILPPGLPPG